MPEEVANAIAFLASDSGGPLLRELHWVVDGGQMAAKLEPGARTPRSSQTAVGSCAEAQRLSRISVSSARFNASFSRPPERPKSRNGVTTTNSVKTR